MCPDPGRERGFTLLEVLVAFAIAALALGIMFKAAGGGLNSARVAGRYEEAVSRARSHLAALGRDAPLRPGQATGDDGGGYTWTLAVTPLATQADPAPLILYGVDVGIGWRENGRHREIVLHTRRLGGPP